MLVSSSVTAYQLASCIHVKRTSDYVMNSRQVSLSGCVGVSGHMAMMGN